MLEQVISSTTAASSPNLTLANAPDAALEQDVLSHVLTLIRLRGGAVHSELLCADEQADFAAGMAHFYFMQYGELVVERSTLKSIDLAAGDLLLLPHGNAHSIASPATDKRPRDTHARSKSVGSTSTEVARFIRGSFGFDSGPMSSLLSGLPEAILLRNGPEGPPPWLVAISSFLLDETQSTCPGGPLMVSRLIDLLVIRTLRSWADSQSNHPGWLSGLNDRRIARALNAMHTEPNRTWSVESLAKIAAMSRSLFAERFNATVGEPPLRYLTKWRLTIAADMLRDTPIKITEAARGTGYSSDAAFSRAFKRHFGFPPSEIQRQLIPR